MPTLPLFGVAPHLRPTLLAGPTRETGIVFLVVGISLCVTAAILFVRKRSKLAHWTRTTGTVIGYSVRMTKRDGRRRTFHHPQVQFARNGESYVLTSPVGSTTPPREVGHTVGILYDPAQPDEACIDTFGEKHFVHALLAAIGTVFAVAGGLVAG